MDNEIKLTVFLKDYAHHIQANNYDFKIRFNCVNFDLFLKVSNKMYNFVRDNTPDGGMRKEEKEEPHQVMRLQCSSNDFSILEKYWVHFRSF